MRGLVTLAVKRRVTILMAAIAVAAFGMVGYNRLPLDLLPNISYPSLTVQTNFPDTAPAEVENLVTRPVEETVGVLKGLHTIHSVSRAGVSEVTLEFEWDSDMDLLSMDVREKLDRLVLPEGSEAPVVLRFDPSYDPVMRLAITGPSTLADLRRIGEKKLKQELETVKGIAGAQIKGGLEDEIQVDVNQDRLSALGIELAWVRQVVGGSNINLPGGSLEDDTSFYLIRTVNEYNSVEEIGDLILRQDARGVVRLKDVATVARGTKEQEEITRVDGVEGIELAVFKEGNANTVASARAVRDRMDALEKALPPDHTITVLFDQSRFVEQAIKEVRQAAIIGGVLAIIVLIAFLRDTRSTVVIATSIPLSVMAAFMVMYRTDVSLNIMSLGGLTLGIGMLVDSSIVVLESIYRRRQEGLSRRDSAIEGTIEVGGAVVASTLTTVAVFLPIVFVEGIAGQLFGDMALTVTYSLIASLLVALTLIPMLSGIGRDTPPTTTLEHDAPQTLGKFSQGYDSMVRGAIKRPALTAIIAFGLFAVSMLGISRIGTELIPEVSEGEFFYEVTMPEGTPLAATNRIMARMEEAVTLEPGIERQYSTVGSRLVAGGASLNTQGENLGQVNLVLKDRADEQGENRVIANLRNAFAGIPDLVAKVGRPAYFSLKTPVEVILYGDNLDVLRDYSLEIVQDLESIPGLVDLRSSLEAGSPELQVVFDRARLASLGLDMQVLSETLRDRIQGAVPTRYKEEDRQIDIRVRNREVDRATAEDVKNLMIPGPDGSSIRLTTVADVHPDRGPAEIHRLKQQRAAIVSANLAERSLGDVVRDIEQRLQSNRPPEGVSVEIGGQNREMEVSFASLKFALALAVFLVYLVMAATFESLIHPFIVLFTIPLALVGVVLGLYVTGTTISVIVLIGTVMLVGIVVNNAIVLIDKVNQLRRAGVEKREAVIRAGHIRLRPILMTTLTTVLGLIPMALAVGQGAELRSPLAITVCFGLVISTFLTLVVIPAVYVLIPSKISPDAEALADATPLASAQGAVS